MGGFVFLLIVLAVIVLGRLGKAAKQSGSTDLSSPSKAPRPNRGQQVRNRAAFGFQQVQQQVEALRQSQRSQRSQPGQSWHSGQAGTSGTAAPPWPAPTITPAVPADGGTTMPPVPPGGSPWGGPPAPAAWVPPVRTPAPPATAYDDTTVVPAVDAAAPVEVGQTPPDVRDDPGVRAFLPHLDQPDTTDPTESVLSSSVSDRYIGSAALESTLDSTIDSTLFGSSDTSATAAVFAMGRPVELPESLETRVRELLRVGHEVAAVGLLCDELHCGIIDAMRTVHTLS